MSDSDDSDDVPLSQLAAKTQVPVSSATISHGVSAPLDEPTPPVPAPAPAPEPSAQKRKRPGREKPLPATKKDKPPGGTSRAARSGAGGWDLSEAAGDLDVDYETLGVLGRGNFAEVNLVRHRKTLELCALKFCCKLDALSYTHLKGESTLASRVRDHPFVLSPIAVADSAGRAGNFSVLLPLCPGGDLLQLLRRQEGNALPEPAVRAYAAMVTLGLDALHDAGLAYRDLKPENLLIKSNGYLCIADFGFTAPLEKCGKAKVGTALYQAPELLRKQPHGAPVDWWALGCLLLEMVTGHSPFYAEDEADTEAAVLAWEMGAPFPSAPTPEAPAGPPVPEDAATEGGSRAVVRPAPPAPSRSFAELCSQLLHPLPSERLGSAGIKAAAWFEGFDWDACLAMTIPAPSTPPPLNPADTDATLLELSRRCQQGFDF